MSDAVDGGMWALGGAAPSACIWVIYWPAG